MSEALVFLFAPFIMCLILVGIHCYLGLHVLARGVIFVDLSLAQVAAFGATVALLMGFEHGSTGAYFISLTATLLAATLFALSKKFEKQFPQEAIIGITYALASGAVILVVDQMAHGAEHIKDALIGQILWVTWPEVGKTALIYSLIGAVHFYFRKQFVESSFGGRNTFWWDFLFYGLFGVIITSSVQVAGVLLVFSFLIVPAVTSQVLFSNLKSRLFFGWGLGNFLCLIGLALSFQWNMPAGALIVVIFTSVPIIFLLARALQALKPT